MTATPRTLILSPHCDDIALSVGGSLLDHARALAPVTGLVIFSTSPFTLDKVHNQHVAEVTAYRAAEEARAATILGYDLVLAGLEEALLRLPGGRSADPLQDPAFGDILDRVRREAENGTIRILGPAGIGGHPDHRVVRAVMDQLASEGLAATMLLYEDLPYMAEIGRETRRVVLDRLLESGLTPWKAPGRRLEGKLAAMREYRSQLSLKHFQDVAGYHRLLHGERIWSYRPERPWPGCLTSPLVAAHARTAGRRTKS